VISLGDVLIEYKELPAAGADLEVLTLTEKNGFVRQTDRFHKRLATEDTSKYKVVRRNDIAFNPYLLWAGAVAQNNVVDEGIISPLYPTFKVRDGYDPVYIGRLLLMPAVIAAYDGIAFGSVPRRRRSSVSDFLSLKIPNPPAQEKQQRIAAILAHADAIRAKSLRISHDLNELSRSVYLSTFGDPMVIGHDHRPLKEVAEIITGNTPSRAVEDNFGRGIEWIKSDNLGGLFATQAEERLSPSGEARARTVPSDSILVTCIAGSPKSIGKASLVDRRVAFNQQINAIRPGPEINARFLLEQLKASPNLVRQKSTGGMKGLVSKSNFSSIEVHVPIIAEQREFVDKLQHVDQLRERRRRMLDYSSELLAALQSRAYFGQL
jgi:type I restriction enzyme S subunit